MICANIEVATGHFQFLLILAAPLNKINYCLLSLLARARQAELSITPAMHAFVLEARERQTAG